MISFFGSIFEIKPIRMYKVFSLLLLLSFSCAKTNQTGSEALLLVGASRTPINPSIGSFIAGDKQNRRFTSIHDSLYVKAVVVDDGKSALAIVTIDCIGLLYTDVERIRDRVAAISQFPKERVMVSSTHTHSGPDVVGIWGSDYEHTGVDSVYMKSLIEFAALQVKKAYDNRSKAFALTGESTFGEPWVQNICDEEIDRSVTIMQFRDLAGNSIASLTNFACHPTFMDAKFTEVSADYVNGFYKELNEAWLGENLFLQGAIGGWVQPVDGESSFAKAEQRGRELGNAVKKALTQSDTLKNIEIRFKSKQVNFPVHNEAWQQLSAIGTIPRTFLDSVKSEIAWFSIGPAQFATHPGETAPYYGLETKKMMQTGPRFVLGLGNDALGYILKPEYFEDKSLPHAEYLTSMSLGKETAPIILKTLKELMDKNLVKE